MVIVAIAMTIAWLLLWLLWLQSSAISAEMERRLYRICAEHKVRQSVFLWYIVHVYRSTLALTCTVGGSAGLSQQLCRPAAAWLPGYVGG